MVIDNFDQILDILEFNNSDEFYFLQIIQRKKDGDQTSVKVVGTAVYGKMVFFSI